MPVPSPVNKSASLLGRTLGGLLVCLVSANAYATFGYYDYGYGTESKGMAGAGIALPQSPLDGLTNPANLVEVGNRWTVGATLFNPNRGYTANGNFDRTGMFPFIPAGEEESQTPLFLIPNMARNWMLDERSSLAISVAGNGGMNTDYDTAVFRNFARPGSPAELAASEPTGIDLVQLAIGLSYARKLGERHAFGVTPILAVQAFRAEGLEPFRAVSVHPEAVTNNGRDYSFGGGVRVGWVTQVNDRLRLGASYQSKLYMSSFDEYRGLFAEEGDFDIAPTWTVGLAFQLTPNVDLAFDVQRFLYERVKALRNKNDFPITPHSLGADDGLGFGWKNMTAAKLGVQWRYRPDLTLRAGFATSNQVVPETQALFNLLAPAVTRRHFTLGATKRLGNDAKLNVSFMHAPREKVSGTNPNTGPQTGFLEMGQNELEISFSKGL